jgi:hypothetical protein
MFAVLVALLFAEFDLISSALLSLCSILLKMRGASFSCFGEPTETIVFDGPADDASFNLIHLPVNMLITLLRCRQMNCDQEIRGSLRC